MNAVICVARQAIVLDVNFDLPGIKFAAKLARYYLALSSPDVSVTPTRVSRCLGIIYLAWIASTIQKPSTKTLITIITGYVTWLCALEYHKITIMIIIMYYV